MRDARERWDWIDAGEKDLADFQDVVGEGPDPACLTLGKKGMKTKEEELTHHRDPITGAPHSHPVATGVGGVGGAAAGMAFGAVLGPVGSLVGGALGAFVGGFAGHELGDEFDPEEEAHWKDRYREEPYYEKDHTYDDYGPAYRFGHESYPLHVGKNYVEAEKELGTQWDKAKGKSRLSWEQAKHAARASWHRLEEKLARRERPDDER